VKNNFSPLAETAAREIVCWHYEPPYDIYNIKDTQKSIRYALDPENNFFAIHDENNELVGFCSFGKDGQVPGGNYTGDALDIGMGIRPDLTGQGFGSDFAASVVDFARKEFSTEKFQVTIANFNQRAQHVWRKIGFRPTQRFIHKYSNEEFIVLTKS